MKFKLIQKGNPQQPAAPDKHCPPTTKTDKYAAKDPAVTIADRLPVTRSGVENKPSGFFKALQRSSFAVRYFFISTLLPGSALSFGQTWQLSPTVTATLTNFTFTVTGTGAIPDYVFSPHPYRDAFLLIDTVKIEEGITRIGSMAFNGCTNLTAVEMPPSLIIIGNYVFGGCGKLMSVNIPSSVTTIGMNAFGFCTSLTSVNIPSSLTGLGGSAFTNCHLLKDVYVNWNTPLSIPATTFDDTPVAAATLHVPAGTKALYQAAAVWKDFGTIVDDSDNSNEAIGSGVLVYAAGNILHIDSPVAEQIEVYTVSGALLYRGTKPDGESTVPLDTQISVIIVKGSSGWVRKFIM